MNSFPISLSVGNSLATDPRPSSSCSSSSMGMGVRRSPAAANMGKKTSLARSNSFASHLKDARSSATDLGQSRSEVSADPGELKAAGRALSLSAASLFGASAISGFVGLDGVSQPEGIQETSGEGENQVDASLLMSLLGGVPDIGSSPVLQAPSGVSGGSSEGGKSFKVLLDRLSALFKKVASEILSKESPAASELSAEPSRADSVYFGGMGKAVSLLTHAQNAPASGNLSETLKGFFIDSGISGLDTAYLDLKNIASDSADKFQSLGLESLSAIIDKLETLLEDKSSDSEHASSHSNALHMLHSMDGRSSLAGSSPLFSIAPDSGLAAVQDSSGRMETILQIQSAMSDMVERMKGEIVFDSPMRRAVIYLDPPALGRLHVQMQMDDTQHVVAQIQADQAATQDFLRQNRDDLRRSFSENGYDPDQIEIRFSDDGNEFSV